MERNMYLRAAAIFAALTSGALGSAQAGVVNFSWSFFGYWIDIEWNWRRRVN